MAVRNKQMRVLIVLGIIIHCLILLFFLHLSNHPFLMDISPVQTSTLTNNYLSPASPISSPFTIVTNRIQIDNNNYKLPHKNAGDIASDLNKYLSGLGSFSKASALKGPRLDRLWNIWDLSYPIDRRDICEKHGNVSAVIVVMSSPGNFQARNSIRSTWGGNLTSDHQIRLVYFVGIPSDRDIERGLKKEAKSEGDVVQTSIIDTYRNLTLKSVMLLRWVSTRCPSAAFVLKVDDDVFIHPTNLRQFVNNRIDKRLTIFGRAAHQWQPVRTNSSHYYVEEDLWTSSIYPDFMTGPAYLLTMDSVPLLLKQVSKVPFFFLEDVYVTGMLAEKTAISRIHCAKFRNVFIPVNPCVYHKAISIHRLNPPTMRFAWDILQRFPTADVDGCWIEKCSWMLFGLCMATDKTAVNFLQRFNDTKVKLSGIRAAY